MQHITVSESFKKMTVKAILSICLFIVTYLALMILALIFTFISAYAGIAIIVYKPTFFTLLVGVGLVAMGILILFFLAKFIFKKNIVDRSHLIEITAEQEPKLFAFIQKIVDEVKTDFPKKNYLSSDVNASVFYDSSFLSMFLPIKKNLQIGVGLVNSVSVSEFEAILAHEFGHFSQRSMKVGSYVYNVNQIIYNLLYENDSFESKASSIANVHSYLAFFVAIALRIIKGIQWILQKIYDIVNLSYMSLSREMEFHADEVAANVAGSEPLITSLLRLDLADQSYNAVINYYSEKIGEAIKPSNIYPQHQFVMNFLAKENKLPNENNLPQVDISNFNRYNKTKLVITNQWASHPNTEDRVAALQKLNIGVKNNKPEKAIVLFNNIDVVQEKITDNLFSRIDYTTEIKDEKTEEFIEAYTKDYRANTFDSIFNCYYDNKNPVYFEKDSLESAKNLSFNDLYSDNAIDTVYTSIAVERDIQTITQIKSGDLVIKSFDYDGVKYSPKQCDELIPILETELARLKEEIDINDKAIFQYFLQLAQTQSLETEYLNQYQAYDEIDKSYDEQFEIYAKMMNATAFINYNTPFEVIEQNINTIYELEKSFKEQIGKLLSDERYQSVITDEIRENLNKYLSEVFVYFSRPTYDDNALNIMMMSIQQYQYIIGRKFFESKKELLNFMVKLTKQ
ncbi:M48 family metallopeptidase [Arcicella lustrica]|uniref:M48 family metallopeptidase n=1 Tax=Arcicella lustrica TaxID=2984196 RepID=A0ABU5SH86_9BACT|nr:M48 family metallopeptidase [Arcicella sp. DC25W]MEA5426634.1 M48 family metallopeptidase [Arcicella sp. DC25W]